MACTVAEVLLEQIEWKSLWLSRSRLPWTSSFLSIFGQCYAQQLNRDASYRYYRRCMQVSALSSRRLLRANIVFFCLSSKGFQSSLLFPGSYQDVCKVYYLPPVSLLGLWCVSYSHWNVNAIAYVSHNHQEQVDTRRLAPSSIPKLAMRRCVRENFKNLGLGSSSLPVVVSQPDEKPCIMVRRIPNAYEWIIKPKEIYFFISLIGHSGWKFFCSIFSQKILTDLNT